MLFDASGKLILRDPSILTHDFQEATLPTWMSTHTTGTATGATYPHVTAATELRPGINVTTAAAINARATVAGQGFRHNGARAWRFTVEFSMGATAPDYLNMECLNSSKIEGAGWGTYDLNAPDLVVGNGSGLLLARSWTTYAQPNKTYKFSVLVDRVERTVYLMVGDTVRDMWADSGMSVSSATLTPSFNVVNNATTATASSVTLHRFRLEKWWV